MLAPNKEIERSFPHAFEAERELLGTMLVNNEVRQLVRNILNEDDFYEGAHGRIYRTASRLIEEGKTATAVTLMPLLRDDEALKELDGGASSYIAGLVGAVTTIVNAPEHARIIAECARQRRVAEVGRVLSEEAQRGGTSELNHLVGKAMEELLADSAAAGQESTKPSRYTLSAAADKVVSRVNDAFQIGKSAENMPYPGLDVLAGAIGSLDKDAQTDCFDKVRARLLCTRADTAEAIARDCSDKRLEKLQDIESEALWDVIHARAIQRWQIAFKLELLEELLHRGDDWFDRREFFLIASTRIDLTHSYPVKTVENGS